jgi:hypothetical protein
MTERVKVHFGNGASRCTYEYDVREGHASFVVSYYGQDRPRFNSGPGGPAPDNAPAFYGPPERASEGARIAEGVAAQRK